MTLTSASRSSRTVKSRLSRAVSFSSSLVRFDVSVFFGPVLGQPAVLGRLGDLKVLDDLDYRASVIKHLLALPDHSDDLLGRVSTCHDSNALRNSHQELLKPWAVPTG